MAIELGNELSLSPEEQWKAQQESMEMFKRDYPEIPIINIEDIGQAVVSLEGYKSLDPNRPYDGQSHTDMGTRGKTEVKGLTMRDIRDCFIRAYIISHPYYVYDEVKRECTLIRQEPNATLIDEANKGIHAKLNGNDVFSLVGDIDPIAVSQNLGCEIEKMMGIFPNVPKLRHCAPETSQVAESHVMNISEPGQSPVPPCDDCSLRECDDKSSY